MKYYIKGNSETIRLIIRHFITFRKYFNRGIIEKVVDYHILVLMYVRCLETFSESNDFVKT
jgi:hypothetical protein